MPSSAIHVLTIAELLDAIFQFLDRKSNTSNALVCKQWSDVALDVLWQEVENVVPLFNILAPMKGSLGDQCFTRRLETSDWQRFDRYRFRVKSLSYDISDRRGLAREAFNEISRTRTSIVIFPNLHTLKWLDGPHLELCIIFMHDNVKRFTAELSENKDYDYLFREVAIRMPHITHFDLRPEDYSTKNEPGIIQLLPRLTNLTELTLPPRHFTTGIAEAVAYNQKLESISLGSPSFDYSYDALDPRLQEGAFPSLSKLAIGENFTNSSSFLLNLPILATLTELHIMSELNELPADVARLIALIVKNCQHLRSLSLTRFDLNPTEFFYHHDEEKNCIDISHLRPLFQLQSLVHCKIIHAYPLLLQPVDIEEIAMSMPNVETLILNNAPFSDEPTLTLDALLPFARHCPRLHILGLFINAEVDDRQYILYPTFDYPVFRGLRRLSLGYSVLEDEYRVAWFLSKICPMGCVIESDASEDGNPYMGRSHEQWENTIKVLSLLRKVRAEENERPGLLSGKT